MFASFLSVLVDFIVREPLNISSYRDTKESSAPTSRWKYMYIFCLVGKACKANIPFVSCFYFSLLVGAENSPIVAVVLYIGGLDVCRLMLDPELAIGLAGFLLWLGQLAWV